MREEEDQGGWFGSEWEDDIPTDELPRAAAALAVRTPVPSALRTQGKEARSRRRAVWRREFRVAASLLAGFFAIVTVWFMLSPDTVATRVRGAVSAEVDAYYGGIATRAAAGTLSEADRVVAVFSVRLLIVGGYFLWPEQSQEMYWYLYGEGADQELDSRWIRRQHLIRRFLAGKSSGVFAHPVLNGAFEEEVAAQREARAKDRRDGFESYSQADAPWRLVFAISPFTVTVQEAGPVSERVRSFELKHHVVYPAPDPRITRPYRVGSLVIHFPIGLIHLAGDGVPYTVYARWEKPVSDPDDLDRRRAERKRRSK